MQIYTVQFQQKKWMEHVVMLLLTKCVLGMLPSVGCWEQWCYEHGVQISESLLSILWGQPYLWARLDRKPNKLAEKRFKNFLHSKQNSKGWVPVEKNNKQYCWHSSVVNYEFEIALVLRHHSDNPGLLEISAVPLSDLLEQTLELIGTNINGNPYGLGSKKHPLHLLIPHGAFQIRNLPTLKHNDLLSWFEGCREGKIEGIVWHCSDGCLIKVHRHHLGLSWPIPDTYMNSKPVIINMNLNNYVYAFDAKCLFNHFSKIDNQKFGRLKDIILNV
ncbi:uncharacterized protein C12orf29 homolog isoform X5 [Orcinus orca]|uniref:uncharacterized protein C12orf29 homolog isoform X5 n=1 Tax=Orcinus orca TaxID=9733 RepID=UPI002112DAE2|nr:uncharacterized protein C12orf29 homolog isoform X5 [Orcinus orca]